MSTQSATTNRLTALFGGAEYDLSALAESPPPQVPQHVRDVAETFYRALDFSGLQRTERYTAQEEYQETEGRFFPKTVTKVRAVERTRTAPLTKAELFATYPPMLQKIRNQHAALSNFLTDQVAASLDLRNVTMPHPEWRREIASELLDHFGIRLPLHLPNVQRGALALKPAEAIHATMVQSLKNAVTRLASDFHDVQRKLRDAGFVGKFELLGGKAKPAGDGYVVAFNFYRWIITDRKGQTQSSATTETMSSVAGRLRRVTERVTTTTKRDVERTFGHALHHHEIMDATFAWLLGDDSRKPPRVVEFVNKVPRPIASCLIVLTGQEIYRRTVERDLRTEKFTETSVTVNVQEQVFNYDPAIVMLPDFCLVGWGADELI